MKKTTNFFLTVLFFAVSLIAGGSNGNSSAYQSGGNDHIVLSQNLPTASSLADLALDWQQNSHVTWRSGRDIFYACTDMSGNWLLKENGTPVPNRKMATLSTATFAPAIAVDSKGNAHIVAANGISAILYLKLAADGTELIRRTLTFKVNLNWVYFHGADVAIDPKTDLPVVGTMCVLETSTTVSGYPMTKHQERIYGLQLDASGEITDKIFFAASDWALGCPPYVFGHPAIDVDNNGVVHAVWKTRMLVDSAKEDSSDIGSSIGGAIGISSSNSSPDPNGSLAEKFRASNRHGVSYSVGDIMIEYARSDKVSQGVAKMLKFGGVYINTPGDIKQGTYLPLPRIVCDDEDRVHVAWNGMNGDKPAILYSRIWADTEDSSGSSIPELMQMGVIEQRSVQVNSAQAKVREDQCDLAVGDSAVHFVWIDARNSISGSQVFHGAVSLSGVVQESQEYAISSRRNNDLTLPRIAFRADRVFKEWVGYNGDNTPGADDLFVATDAETAVNLYPAQEIRITATYEPWLHGEAAASDPEIVLQGNPDGLAYERVFLAADDGRGQYTVLWQEAFPNRDIYDICLHRRRYWAQTYGLLPGSEQLNRLWDRQDAQDALGESNRTQGTVINLPIPIRPAYADLVRESNYHEAQGFAADGVTPFIIRVALPPGKYYVRLQAAPDTDAGGVANYIENERLFRFSFNPNDPDQGSFDKIGFLDSFNVYSEHPGLEPKETIFLIKGFDWTNIDAAWPPDKPALSLQLKLWQYQVNNSNILDTNTDEPYAIIPFGVSRPPLVLLHGFNNAGAGWTSEFLEPLKNLVGPDMLSVIDYGQSMTPQGPWATWEKMVEDSTNAAIKLARRELGSEYVDEKLEYKLIRDEYKAAKEKVDNAKKTIEESKKLLQALGFLESEEDDDDDTDWLAGAKKVLYWEKAANAVDDLETLEKEVALNLYATEQILRHRNGWAFTRYDVIGHCQGAILLRMLATNASEVPLPMQFLQPNNFGRGRFRSLTAIGAPFRGSKLTQYYRHYYAHIQEMLQELVENHEYQMIASSLLQHLGGGLGLLYYADRHGYLENKFDAYDGEVMQLGTKYPVHPLAKFHYVSTVIDHDAKIPWTLFASFGLAKDAQHPGYNLFELLYPPYGTTNRFSDGLIDWRSHLAGLDYTNNANKQYISFLDELGTGDRRFAAHVPPFSLKAFFGVEDPEGPSLADILECVKDGVTLDWKSILKRFGEEMLKKMMKNHDVLFSPFGTMNTQTSLSAIGCHLAEEILAKPVNEHFTRHVEYNPQLPKGEGNPENWGSLAQQELNLGEAVRSRLRFFLAQSREWDFLEMLSTRSALPPGTYRYKLNLPEGMSLSSAASPAVIWSISVQNELLNNSMGVEVTPDLDDPTAVTVSISEDVMGTVVLNCAFFNEEGQFVQLSPLQLATLGMGEISGIHFSTFAPVLSPGEQVFFMLDAEYSSGYYGPLFLQKGEGLTWSSSDPEVATIEAGQLCAGNKPGKTTITVNYGNFSSSATIRVTVPSPNVELQTISNPLDFVGGDSLTLSAKVQSDVAIKGLIFIANGAFIGEGNLTDGNYHFTWANLPAGQHEIQALAVDEQEELGFSSIQVISVANRPPLITAWNAPAAGAWYGGEVYCAVEAEDPDGDRVTVQFEYSLDGIKWSQCYYSLTEAPFDCIWNSFPRNGLNDNVHLRVWAVDEYGASSEILTRSIKIDNSSSGLTFNPHPGEISIPLNVKPTISFANPISKADGNPLNVNELANYFGLQQQGQTVTATLAISQDKKIITITPTAPLHGVTAYTTCILKEVKDSAENLSRPTGASFVTSFGTPAALEFRQLSPRGEAGQPLDTALRVHVVDAWSNTVTTGEVAVTLSSGDGAEVNGTLTKTSENGIAVFENIVFTLAGNRQLIAQANGLSAGTLNNIAIRPTSLARLELELSETAVTAGTRISATVSAFDTFDNKKTNYNGVPVFSCSDSAAQLPGLYAFYETDEGTHTYRNTLMLRSLGTQKVQVKDGAISSPSVSIEVSNAPPQAPTLLAPEEKSFTGLVPTLQLGEFVDIDDAGHAGTQFQVALTEDFAEDEVLWDSNVLPAVLTVTLPEDILSEYTCYYWRARVKDGSSDPDTEWSDWSTASSFRTAYAFPFFDNFSVDRGWQGLSANGWSIGPACGGGGENGNPNPIDDVTQDNDDRQILVYKLGGDYQPNADASVISPPVDCSKADIVELSFWRWLGVEGNAWGNASISVSDDGHKWQEVWSNPATDISDEQWQHLVYDLTPWTAGKQTVFIKFRMGPMFDSYPFCGWNIDDLQLAEADEKLAKIILEVDREDIQIGDTFNVDIYVQEDHPEAAGLLGASVLLDYNEGLSNYYGSGYVYSCIPAQPWNVLRRGVRGVNVLTELSGITSTEGHGDGTPVLLARVPMRATSAGLARFVCEPAAAFALPSPFGQLGQWRVAGATLEFEIATAAVLPLARLTLVGPTAPIALGNTFTIQVFAEEMSPEAKGFLGGPFDLYFEQNYVSVPDFSAAEAIQPPYRDVGLLSGTLRENRIDELGGATVQTGHGNGTKVLYALINFKAEAVGETVFSTTAGESGLTLTTPVGQLPFERIDYGQPFIVDIRPNFTVNISGGNSSESNCYAGQIVDLTAEDPEPGWQFSHWSGDETSLSALDDVNEANTSLIVPTAAVELEAKYVLIDYSLTVNGGSGSASPVHIGDQLEISADPPAIGMTFDCWIGDVRYLANPNAATTTVTVETSDISVTAKYRNLLYNTEIINGTGSSNTAVYGQRLTIVANAAPLGHAFAGWVGNEEDLACLAARYAMTTTLTQPDRDVTLTASYLAVDYQLTVINGSGTTIANYNDVISIVADEAATGQAFSHWSGDIAYLDNPQAATTNVTMPANNVTLTAVYSQVPYTLLVVNGTGSGTYYYEDEVTITAVPPSGGTGFATWVGHVQTLQNETVTETILTMPAAHTAVVAVYGTYDIDTIDLHLKAGWNCIAVPFETANPLGTKDSKGNEISRIWHWEGRFVTPKDETGVISETIKPNIGYWIFVKEDCTISFTRWEKE